MTQHGDFGDTSVTVCSLSGRVGGFLHYFPSSFSISSTCQVGHLDLEILLSHISSNFCDVFCWTLHINVETPKLDENRTVKAVFTYTKKHDFFLKSTKCDMLLPKTSFGVCDMNAVKPTSITCTGQCSLSVWNMIF